MADWIVYFFMINWFTPLANYNLLLVILIAIGIGLHWVAKTIKNRQSSPSLRQKICNNREYATIILASSLAIMACIFFPVISKMVQNNIQEHTDNRLSDAIRYRDLELVKKYLTPNNLNAHLIYSLPFHDKPPLFLAVSGYMPQVGAKESLEIIDYLLKNGADLNLKASADAYSILHCAEDPCVADYLIKKGANVNAYDLYNETPLSSAVKNRGSVDLLKVFLDHNANVNTLDNSKRTPLDSILENEKRNNEIKRLLLEHGAKTSQELKDVQDGEKQKCR